MGMWSLIPSATISEIGALAGLDFQILDLEHGSYDLSSLEENIRACEIANCSPIVRVPNLNPSIFQSVLDLGAHGIIAPQINNKEDAELVVKYTKFPPRGCRGYNPFTRSADYSNPPNNQIGKLDNSFCLISVIIENNDAYSDLHRILEIQEIDVIYLGIYDMSLALNCDGNTQDPRVLEKLTRSITPSVWGYEEIKKSLVLISLLQILDLKIVLQKFFQLVLLLLL